jgi:transcription initiation factor TFIIE subunit alpha
MHQKKRTRDDTMAQKLKLTKPTKKMTEEVVTELVGEHALQIIDFLRGKTKISEFIIAEELELEINETRNILYKLLEHNIVSFLRKKDRIKGWYICYWDFNEHMIPQLQKKMNVQKLEKMEERLERETAYTFFMCNNACSRMDFDKAMEFNFKCPECGSLMHQQDNQRTVEFLKDRIEELKVLVQ